MFVGLNREPTTWVIGAYMYLVSFLFLLSPSLCLGGSLVHRVVAQSCTELPENVVHYGRLLHLLQQPLETLQEEFKKDVLEPLPLPCRFHMSDAILKLDF